jgi:hypothetical protein
MRTIAAATAEIPRSLRSLANIEERAGAAAARRSFG